MQGCQAVALASSSREHPKARTCACVTAAHRLLMTASCHDRGLSTRLYKLPIRTKSVHSLRPLKGANVVPRTVDGAALMHCSGRPQKPGFPAAADACLGSMLGCKSRGQKAGRSSSLSSSECSQPHQAMRSASSLIRRSPDAMGTHTAAATLLQ